MKISIAYFVPAGIGYLINARAIALYPRVVWNNTDRKKDILTFFRTGDKIEENKRE